jgi:molybdate transport system regulatory protein
MASRDGRRTAMAELKLRSRQWIVDENDNIIMGEGRMAILENIERMGSINQAAKVMKMSYKAVWGKIKATEASLNTRIVDADKKSGTRLTLEGKDLLERYRHLKKMCTRADEQAFESIFGRGQGS